MISKKIQISIDNYHFVNIHWTHYATHQDQAMYLSIISMPSGVLHNAQ
jgi:hypothetical protein